MFMVYSVHTNAAIKSLDEISREKHSFIGDLLFLQTYLALPFQQYSWRPQLASWSCKSTGNSGRINTIHSHLGVRNKLSLVIMLEALFTVKYGFKLIYSKVLKLMWIIEEEVLKYDIINNGLHRSSKVIRKGKLHTSVS